MTKKQERNNLRPGRGISGRTMFSTVLLLFGIVINLNAQERTKVSFKFQKTTFEQVIQEIQKQTDYDFIYNSKAFPQKSFAIEAQNREVKSILDELSRDLGLEYTIMNKVITLRMKNTPSSSAPQSDQGLRIIKGKVVDEKGEPLPGVSVVVKNTVQGTASDVNGNFTIKPEGQEKIILQFSMIGMQRQEVEYKGEQELKIVMRENNETLNEVMVIGYGSTT
ncbi:MAG: carboxypeptidase-like regulatory domain-containing protein [Odoribacter splanchnicus]